MSKTLYIHIGTGKTGTTALQSFFHTNANDIKKRLGLTYCKSGLIEINHHLLCQNSNRNKESTKNLILEKIELLNKEIQKTDGDFFFVSSENFPGLKPSEINHLKETINAKIIPIVYLRRQDEYLESWYAQIIKTGSTSQSIKNLYKRLSKNRILDYKYLVDNWSKINSEGKVIVNVYEKNSFSERDIFTDFFKSIGIEINSEEFELPSRNPNPSINAAQIKIGYDLQDYCTPEQRRYLFLPYSEFKDPSAFILSQAERQEIIDSYAESNNEVAKSYLSRDQLFHDQKARTSLNIDQVARDIVLEKFLLVLFCHHIEKFKVIEDPVIRYLIAKTGMFKEIGELEMARRLIKLALIFRPNGPKLREIDSNLLGD